MRKRERERGGERGGERDGRESIGRMKELLPVALLADGFRCIAGDMAEQSVIVWGAERHGREDG